MAEITLIDAVASEQVIADGERNLEEKLARKLFVSRVRSLLAHLDSGTVTTRITATHTLH